MKPIARPRQVRDLVLQLRGDEHDAIRDLVLRHAGVPITAEQLGQLVTVELRFGGGARQVAQVEVRG